MRPIGCGPSGTMLELVSYDWLSGAGYCDNVSVAAVRVAQ